jgi:RNA ligase (TIGR02306 family)
MNDSLLIEVSKVIDIQAHPNADRLDVATIKGWDVVVPKNTLSKDELVVYIPPESILPESLHTFLGITKYCAELPKGYGCGEELEDNSCRPKARRIKATRLRGVSSYGTIMSKQQLINYIDTIDDIWREGNNLAELLQIAKWNPPIKSTQGDVERDNVDFPKYSAPVHYKNYPDILEDNEDVVILEKVHGSLTRLGFAEKEIDGYKDRWFVAGSHNTNRKEFDSGGNRCLYWMPYQWYPAIESLLTQLYEIFKQTPILYGEIYGSGVQDLDYGLSNGKKGFAAFDLSIGHKYCSWDYTKKICERYQIPLVPELFRGPYTKSVVEQFTSGHSHVVTAPTTHIREGIVVKPICERVHPEIGRVILKNISIDYLER